MSSNSFTEGLIGLTLLLCSAISLWLAMRFDHAVARVALFIIFGVALAGCGWTLLDYAGVWRLIR